jgi:hypothetical protein
MEALICGYEVAAEVTPEDKVREYYVTTKNHFHEASETEEDYYFGVKDGILTTLSILGINIKGVNA